MSGCGGRDVDPGEPLARRVRREKINAWFDSMHCVLWPSGCYDLTDSKEREQAIHWVESMLDGLQ